MSTAAFSTLMLLVWHGGADTMSLKHNTGSGSFPQGSVVWHQQGHAASKDPLADPRMP